MRILLVEDDPILGDGVQVGLGQLHYVVDWVTDGVQAELALKNAVYEALVLDLGLPRLSGLHVLKNIREKSSNLPVIIVTAKDAIEDRITGLDAGADDYLVKPFAIDELAARLRAINRRRGGRATSCLQFADIVLDPAAHSVTFQNTPVSLSSKEFAILRRLLESQGHVLSKSQLEEACYGWDQEPESNAIEVYIHNLRQKLSKTVIKTVRGVGYVLVDGTSA